MLKLQKVRIEDLDERVSAAKSAYNDALKRLEEISEEIHRLRKEREGGGTSSNSDREEDDNGQSTIVSHISSSSGAVQAGTSHGPVEDPMDDVINRFNSTGINSTDEYMDFPKKMTTKSSPVRQKKVGELDCPHMYQDFTSSKSGQMVRDWKIPGKIRFFVHNLNINIFSFPDQRSNRAMDRDSVVPFGEFQFRVLECFNGCRWH